MEEVYNDLIPYINSSEMAMFAIEKIKKLRVSGFLIKDFGGPGFNNLELGTILFEISKRDASVCSAVAAHNIIGTAVINELGDEE